jgi:predicted small lipoprotein YifL
MFVNYPVRVLLLALLLGLAGVSGCGQKGPLYLPEESGQETRQ